MMTRKQRTILELFLLFAFAFIFSISAAVLNFKIDELNWWIWIIGCNVILHMLLPKFIRTLRVQS